MSPGGVKGFSKPVYIGSINQERIAKIARLTAEIEERWPGRGARRYRCRGDHPALHDLYDRIDLLCQACLESGEYGVASAIARICGVQSSTLRFRILKRGETRKFVKKRAEKRKRPWTDC